ncbi:MAG: hypothetical protein MI700_10155, partial [Balneolales bacterium]|nr:hypothetical protein [Balneolales bacterium]
GIYALTGCESGSDSSEVEGIPLGRFTGLVGNDNSTGIYEELAGYAYFYLNEKDSTLQIALESSVVSSEKLTYVYLIIQPDSIPNPGPYSLRDIDSFDQFDSTGFSGLYVSPILALGYLYYSESGTIVVESVSEEGIKGTLSGRFYYKVSVGPDEYSRSYTDIEADFNAIIWDESKF